MAAAAPTLSLSLSSRRLYFARFYSTMQHLLLLYIDEVRRYTRATPSKVMWHRIVQTKEEIDARERAIKMLPFDARAKFISILPN